MRTSSGKNFAVARYIVLNLLAVEKSFKAGIKRSKRKRIAAMRASHNSLRGKELRNLALNFSMLRYNMLLKRVNLKTILIAILFFSSLRITAPIGIYGFTFLLPTVLSGLILIKSNQFNKNTIFVMFLFEVIVLTNALILNNNAGWSKYLHLEMYLFISANIFIYGTLLSSSNRLLDKYFFDNASKVLIMFHVSALILQVVAWYIFSIDIDYGLILGGNEHRAFYYGLYRPTGVYAEPSIYAGYMIIFLCLRYVYAGKMDKWFLLGLISLPVTLSTFAVLAFIVVATIVYFRPKISNLFVLFIGLVFIFYSQFESLVERYSKFISGTDGSNNAKLYILEQWYNSDFYFTGFGTIKKVMFDGRLDGLGDLTFYINMFMQFGVFSGLILLILFFAGVYFNVKDNRKRLFLLFSVVKFSSFSHPMFWFFLYLIISKNDEKITN
tara:strand:- start:5223 stop:6542 length:1320 start_codon:yes stop_codon:yes gene_type:complete